MLVDASAMMRLFAIGRNSTLNGYPSRESRAPPARPNIGTTGVTTFSRFDFQLSREHALTSAILYSPGHTTSAGLSTLRPAATVPDVDVLDVFVGVTDRWIATPRDLVTFRVGVAAHETAIVPQGSGAPDPHAGWMAEQLVLVG